MFICIHNTTTALIRRYGSGQPMAILKYACSYILLYMYFIKTLFMQMIIRLKEFLKRDNITVDERIFETGDGIAGLGDIPFVSIL